MGAYEGAGITVLAKGVKIPGRHNPFRLRRVPGRHARFSRHQLTAAVRRKPNPYPSNFLCNPSSIDGLTVKNSSQGGGGILVHAWGHDLQIANNRVTQQPGHPVRRHHRRPGRTPRRPRSAVQPPRFPGSCITYQHGSPANMALPYCFNMDVNVHHNAVIAELLLWVTNCSRPPRPEPAASRSATAATTTSSTTTGSAAT